MSERIKVKVQSVLLTARRIRANQIFDLLAQRLEGATGSYQSGRISEADFDKIVADVTKQYVDIKEFADSRP